MPEQTSDAESALVCPPCGEARNTLCQFRGKVGGVGVMLNSLVNLMSSRIAWKMGLWANCDVGGRKTFSLVGGTILWAELDREKRRKQVEHWHSSLSASRLWMQYDQLLRATSALTSPPWDALYPWTMNWNSPPSSYFCQGILSQWQRRKLW